MSTGQQLGLIGNSIKVQSLPTASAETFGAGNRFYTLIGQQEGYITGHTYRTVVANDVYSWEDVGNALMLLALVDGTITANSSIEVALSNFSRQPLVDDTLIVYSNASQYALMKVSAVTSTAATLIVKDNSAANIVSTKGIDGEAGLTCLRLATTKFYISKQYSIPLSAFNRTPKVGETFIRYSTEGEYALLQVDSITSTEAVCTVPGSSANIVSTGRDALQLKDAYNFSTHVGQTLNFAESSFNRTPVVNETFVFFDAQNQYGTAQVKSSQTISGQVHWFSTVLTVVSTKGEIGATGAAGVGVTNATAGTPTVADGKTTTPITFSLSDGSTKQVSVEAQNGADGQSNYNLLSNIPVINQDLTASGFTPVANTYYRHTGTTTDLYINGVIYYYNGTGYAALDGSGSGGGTTLNKYTYSGTNAERLNRIVKNAKSISAAAINGFNVAIANMPNEPNRAEFYAISYTGTLIEIRSFKTQSSSKFVSYAEIKTDGTVSVTVNASSSFNIVVEYWNDTEIT